MGKWRMLTRKVNFYILNKTIGRQGKKAKIWSTLKARLRLVCGLISIGHYKIFAQKNATMKAIFETAMWDQTLLYKPLANEANRTICFSRNHTLFTIVFFFTHYDSCIILLRQPRCLSKSDKVLWLRNPTPLH